MVAVVDRLEQQRVDGSDDFHVATDGIDLVDDVAYVMTFRLNRTFSRDHAQVHRLVIGDGTSGGGSAKALGADLFDPQEMVQLDLKYCAVSWRPCWPWGATALLGSCEPS